MLPETRIMSITKENLPLPFKRLVFFLFTAVQSSYNFIMTKNANNYVKMRIIIIIIIIITTTTIIILSITKCFNLIGSQQPIFIA